MLENLLLALVHVEDDTILCVVACDKRRQGEAVRQGHSSHWILGQSVWGRVDEESGTAGLFRRVAPGRHHRARHDPDRRINELR